MKTNIFIVIDFLYNILYTSSTFFRMWCTCIWHWCLAFQPTIQSNWKYLLLYANKGLKTKINFTRIKPCLNNILYVYHCVRIDIVNLFYCYFWARKSCLTNSVFLSLYP